MRGPFSRWWGFQFNIPKENGSTIYFCILEALLDTIWILYMIKEWKYIIYWRFFSQHNLLMHEKIKLVGTLINFSSCKLFRTNWNKIGKQFDWDTIKEMAERFESFSKYNYIFVNWKPITCSSMISRRRYFF